MSKSYAIRILEYLDKNNVTLTRATAAKAFRKENKNLGPIGFDDSVMRTARRLRADGLLARKGRGEYALTKTARKMLASN